MAVAGDNLELVAVGDGNGRANSVESCIHGVGSDDATPDFL